MTRQRLLVVAFIFLFFMTLLTLVPTKFSCRLEDLASLLSKSSAISSNRSTTPGVVAMTLPDDVAVEALINVSRQLNDLQKRLQQLQCRTAGFDRSETGGWCEPAASSGSGLHLTDSGLAAALATVMAGKTVVSLGEGLGTYRQLIMNSSSSSSSSSKVIEYDAYDGAPFCEEQTGGVVRFLDLTLPQYWLRRYDWVICLEVVEHVAQENESTVLDNIVRPAIEGIVMSWAAPDQPGAWHVNPREPAYVEAVMKGRGLILDDEMTSLLRNSSELSWFRQHTNVFRTPKKIVNK